MIVRWKIYAQYTRIQRNLQIPNIDKKKTYGEIQSRKKNMV